MAAVGILANHLRIEIAAVDIQTNNVYIYTPDIASDDRIYVIYDGNTLLCFLYPFLFSWPQ